MNRIYKLLLIQPHAQILCFIIPQTQNYQERTVPTIKASLSLCWLNTSAWLLYLFLAPSTLASTTGIRGVWGEDMNRPGAVLPGNGNLTWSYGSNESVLSGHTFLASAMYPPPVSNRALENSWEHGVYPKQTQQDRVQSLLKTLWWTRCSWDLNLQSSYW